MWLKIALKFYSGSFPNILKYINTGNIFNTGHTIIGIYNKLKYLRKQ